MAVGFDDFGQLAGHVVRVSFYPAECIRFVQKIAEQVVTGLCGGSEEFRDCWGAVVSVVLQIMGVLFLSG